MSVHLRRIIEIAIQEYLNKNGYYTIGPNMLSERTQEDLAEYIEDAVSRYIGSIKRYD